MWLWEGRGRNYSWVYGGVLWGTCAQVAFLEEYGQTRLFTTCGGHGTCKTHMSYRIEEGHYTVAWFFRPDGRFYDYTG